jgi:hypothetical protein
MDLRREEATKVLADEMCVSEEAEEGEDGFLKG